jgi:hypothetical protein
MWANTEYAPEGYHVSIYRTCTSSYGIEKRKRTEIQTYIMCLVCFLSCLMRKRTSSYDFLRLLSLQLTRGNRRATIAMGSCKRLTSPRISRRRTRVPWATGCKQKPSPTALEGRTARRQCPSRPRRKSPAQLARCNRPRIGRRGSVAIAWRFILFYFSICLFFETF